MSSSPAYQRVDPPGTCHLVGCPLKGEHPPHSIGCPDSFEPYKRPSTLPRSVVLTEEDVIHLLDWHNKPSCGDEDRAMFHRLSHALAVTRNTARGGLTMTDVTPPSRVVYLLGRWHRFVPFWLLRRLTLREDDSLARGIEKDSSRAGESRG